MGDIAEGEGQGTPAPKLTMAKRDLQEIEHALYYAKNWAHGTVGHNQLMLIAALASQLGFRLDPNTDTLVIPNTIRVAIAESSR